ncbi:MAG: acetyl-CoA carboxylase biotin carboxyl carrier protein subunit [Alkaliphilus sp.]|nr:biotin/lipoyl-binding protein [bacterium AH-315-L21]PHS33380.1 MAG: acetyl-CoA carboxylase biotin carboxyl carrier protein subunit [Alkaliphilus sp.]
MKKYNITVNGVSYEVEVEELNGVEQSIPTNRSVAPTPKSSPKAMVKPAKATQKPAAVSAGATTVTAPMPGNIWKVQVKEGQQVKEGDVLIILEAMKMENEIMAEQDATVAKIHVVEGAAVNGGDLLVSLN